MTQDELNLLSRQVLDAAYRVHTGLGPGLLESAYTACLAYELMKEGLSVEGEVPVPLIWDEKKLTDVGYRIDLLIEGQIIIEVKSLEAIAEVHLLQLVSYLKLADRRLGFLINFNVASLREGIYRRVHRF